MGPFLAGFVGAFSAFVAAVVLFLACVAPVPAQAASMTVGPVSVRWHKPAIKPAHKGLVRYANNAARSLRF